MKSRINKSTIIKTVIITVTALILMLIVACLGGTVQRDLAPTSDDLCADSETNENVKEATSKRENKESSIDKETSTKKEIEETTKPLYQPVSMAFVGDVYIGDKAWNSYNTNGLLGIFSPNIISIFKESSVSGINHEYVASDAGDEHKVDYEKWYYKSPTAYEKIISELGIDVVTLANNHTMDYGEEGLIDTMNALNSVGVDYVGVGNNLEEALSPAIYEVSGKKVAVLAANRVVPRVDWYAGPAKVGQLTTYESTDRYLMIKAEITRLKSAGVQAVVVLVHFGENKDTTIQDYQYNVAHGYADAGADLIIGCHSHALQGAEIYNGKYIFYGIGNFLFENYAVDTVMVHATIEEDDTLKVGLIPCKSQNYVTKDVSGQEANNIFKQIMDMSVNILINSDGQVVLKN